MDEEFVDEVESTDDEELVEAPPVDRAKPVRGLGDKAYERDSEKLVNREQKDQRQRRALAAAHGPGPPGHSASIRGRVARQRGSYQAAIGHGGGAGRRRQRRKRLGRRVQAMGEMIE